MCLPCTLCTLHEAYPAHAGTKFLIFSKWITDLICIVKNPACKPGSCCVVIARSYLTLAVIFFCRLEYFTKVNIVPTPYPLLMVLVTVILCGVFSRTYSEEVTVIACDQTTGEDFLWYVHLYSHMVQYFEWRCILETISTTTPQR